MHDARLRAPVSVAAPGGLCNRIKPGRKSDHCAKVDVDTNIKTSTKFNVRSIPAILFFKDGKLVDQVIGFVGKPALAEKFEKHAA